MSETLGTYSFMPWARQGIANSITADDNAPGVKLRATINIEITMKSRKLDNSDQGEGIPQDIQLYGPGDIIGIQNNAIIRTEPLNWITNFEPNYLSFLEFYDEDFPWRYTPAKANGDRLRPWIALVILKEGEFADEKNMQGKPLPSFALEAGVNAIDIFPDLAQLWAWAHVHVNKDITADTSDAVIAGLEDTLKNNPDHAYSRLICPRRLEPNVSYHAFLIPTFETGRLAGLGEEIPPDTVATASSWGTGQNKFPYYHRWFFRTGAMGDFEYLVNLLKPRTIDKRVGTRDMDVLHPLSNLPPIDDPELGGVLRLGGALRIPQVALSAEDQELVKKYDEWDEHPYPHKFEKAMAARVNLADDYETQTPQDANPDHSPDPVITSPLYGRWHALVTRLLKDKNGNPVPNDKNWVHELNLDPRFRVAAGFGTKIVQTNQEEYMHGAWTQVGDVLAANKMIHFAQLGIWSNYKIYTGTIGKLSRSRQFLLTSPVHSRVMSGTKTLHHTLQHSIVPPVMTSGAFRTITRPSGPLMRKLSFTTEAKPYNLISRVNEGKVLPAPPKVAPARAITLEKAAAGSVPQNVPPAVEKSLRKSKWLIWLPLVIALAILALLFILKPAMPWSAILAVTAGLLILLAVRMFTWNRYVGLVDGLRPENQTPEYIDAIPPRPDFRILEPGESYDPKEGASDSEEGAKFRVALKDALGMLQVHWPLPVRPKLDLPAMNKAAMKALNPTTSIPARVRTQVKLPARFAGAMNEFFEPAMAYPVIDVPMYEPLANVSSELFLPNINLITQNSISLLENNQKFIESYMVGLNHEMARELLWREYPTDQRGSYFRQFWDVRDQYTAHPPTEAEKETLYDIPKLHKWKKASLLGKHNNREKDGDDAQLVLVIRGELLKRYPNAVIYAHKAAWPVKNGQIDKKEERLLAPIPDAQLNDPPKTLVQMPLFEAKVKPDIYFFGFDLTAEEAKGGPGDSLADNPGWFFVIKERPGEPRFGLDEPMGNSQPALYNWNKLSWNHLGTLQGKPIAMDKTFTLVPPPPNPSEEDKKRDEDQFAHWNPNTNSAEIAYILYQVPVMVAVHAWRMLVPNE